MDSLLQEITPICRVYEQYAKKTEEIELFIKIAEEQKEFVENVEVAEEYDSFLGGLRKLSNSVVLYNAAIISIYGSYELFIDEVLKAYLEYLKNRYVLYEKFPAKLREKHLFKAAEFLSNPQRFSNMGLNNGEIISALEASYIQGHSNVLLDKLLLKHSGNLNTKQINELLQEYGFENPLDKIRKHDFFAKEYKNYMPDANGNNVFPLLEQIVEERNKVGHGWIVEDRYSFSLLREKYLDFIRELCGAIKDLIISQIIQNCIDDKKVSKFGQILHIWDSGRIIGINSENFRLKVNEYIYCSTSENWNYVVRIKNLQNDKKDRNEIRAFNKKIAIQVDRKIKKNYILWGYTR